VLKNESLPSQPNKIVNFITSTENCSLSVRDGVYVQESPAPNLDQALGKSFPNEYRTILLVILHNHMIIL
jgi:hypothetical protein